MSFDKKLKLVSLQQAHGNDAAVNPQKSVVVSESLAASTTEETSPLSCTPTAGHNNNNEDDDSSCESLEIGQPIRIMGFTGQDFFAPSPKLKKYTTNFASCHHHLISMDLKPQSLPNTCHELQLFVQGKPTFSL
jgi:hypothetical protein